MSAVYLLATLVCVGYLAGRLREEYNDSTVRRIAACNACGIDPAGSGGATWVPAALVVSVWLVGGLL